MIANWYQANKDQANTALTTAMSLTGNTFILGHNLLTRMTVTALGKEVKPNNSGVTTVSLLFTFASQADEDHFNTMDKGYNDQKSLRINLYPTSKDEIWTKVNVRQCRPDEPMSFTVQSKPAGESATKCRTADKVVIITPTNWGRLSPDDRKNFIQSNFRNREYNPV